MSQQAIIAASRCVHGVLEDGHSLNKQLQYCERKLKDSERGLYRELCYGTLRWYWQLAPVLDGLFDKPLRAKDRIVRSLLLTAVYQLSYLDKPDHAVVNNSVGACQKLGKSWAKGLVNALLRRWQRESEAAMEELSEAAQLAHPQWLYEAINEAWPDQCQNILESNNAHPPLFIRVNRRQISRDEYTQLVKQAGLAVETLAQEDGLWLPQAIPAAALPGWDRGQVSIQDASAQRAADYLPLEPGCRALDACAAPGGKTAHMLERCDVQMDALDIDEQRLASVENLLQRLKLQANLIHGSITETDGWWQGELYDRILLDAPCSATGVIRRNPDIKWHRVPEDVDAVIKTQALALDSAWSLLKPGGYLLYATCSVLPVENQQQIQRFLEQHNDAECITLKAENVVDTGLGLQFLPESGSGDGFFYSLLKKQ